MCMRVRMWYIHTYMHIMHIHMNCLHNHCTIDKYYRNFMEFITYHLENADLSHRESQTWSGYLRWDQRGTVECWGWRPECESCSPRKRGEWFDLLQRMQRRPVPEMLERNLSPQGMLQWQPNPSVFIITWKSLLPRNKLTWNCFLPETK